MSPEQKQTCLITFFNYRTYTCLRVNVEGNLISDYSILPLFLQTTNHFYFIADKATRLLKFVNTVMLFFVVFFSIGRVMHAISALILHCVCVLLKCIPYVLCCYTR